jgi:DNA helicase-4
VLSNQPEFPPAVTAVAVRSNTQYADIIDRHLTRLDTAIGVGTIPPGRDGRTSVYILGRYRKVKEAVQPVLDRKWDHLDSTFNTMHGAKGKEADYVILAGMVRRGMPSTIEDDSLLKLAMPAGDTFTHAEERRLFYVAMTRAKRSVLMLTVDGHESPFLLELIKDGQLTLESATGEEIPIVPCRKCGVGRTIKRNGPYGEFYSCSTYPECDGKMRSRPRR